MRRASAALMGAVLVATLAGCGGGGPGLPGVPGGGGGGDVDPNGCGGSLAAEGGIKIRSFLQASVDLNTAVLEVETNVKEVCAAIASDLGASASGDTKAVCNAAAAAVKDNLKVGLRGGAKLKIEHKPAVCTVSVEAAASAAAECEGSASADVKVACEGGCGGTCKGECSGKCAGGGGGGQCNGKCEGECKGECSGECQGHADVNASAECRASAEVKANVQAECTPPELTVAFEAKVVADKSKVDAVVATLKANLPKLLALQAKVNGPLKATITAWTDSAEELAKGAMKIAGAFGAQATCVAGQIKSAFGMAAGVAGSASISVEASVEVSGSASAGGGA